MGETSIEWTDATWNPVRGCSIVSPGCTNCYAMKFAHRFSGEGKAYAGLTKLTKGGPVWTGKVTTHTDLLDWPLHRRKPSRIFVNSMSDLFHDEVPDIFIADVFASMAYARQHQFQLLTKRPERMARLLVDPKFLDQYDTACAIAHDTACEVLGRRGEFDPNARCKTDIRAFDPSFPLNNVWLGASVEDQPRADERRGAMERLAIEQWLTWVSYEPALALVDWNGWDFLRWLVAGAESGHGRRGFELVWFDVARSWCEDHGVTFFMKQIVTRAGVKLPFEMFPPNLQVREYPA